MSSVEIAAAGDRAVLVTLGRIPAAELHAAAVRLRAANGVLACIVGEESLYVIFGERPSRPQSSSVPLGDHGDRAGRPITAGETPALRIEHLLRDLSHAASSATQHVLRVHFGAADFLEFLSHVSITRTEFLERVAQVRLNARFLGFRAGFAYLDGWPREWQMPRRPTSRPVPRGSFAIAGAMAGFYPIDTPGGWNLLGRTDAALWDPSRTPPNLIAAGDEITLQPVEEELLPPAIVQEPVPSLDGLEILSGGQLTVVVRGADYARLDHGLSPGGPFDQHSAEAANVSVGNRPDAPLLECAMVGPRLRFSRRCAVALPDREPFLVEAGREITVGRLKHMRGYVAIGDRAGRPITAGETPGAPETIYVSRGPHDIGLDAIECEVTPQLNRVGIRMHPLTPIAHRAPADMPSCGVQFGTIQLHPDGSLVAMGPDHPITGGYLQPFTVLWSERWKLGQLAPGDRVRLVAQLPNA